MRNPTIKIKDFQFIKYFLLYEVDLNDKIVNKLLSYMVEIRRDGEPDVVYKNKDNYIIATNPSSVTRFLYNVLFFLLSEYVEQEIYIDKLSLGLLNFAKNYVYEDFDIKEFIGPPVAVNFEKIAIPNLIVREIIEPLVGKIENCKVLYMKCPFTDACRIINTSNELKDQYRLSGVNISNDDFPLILCNASIHNKAAKDACLLKCYLELSFGDEKAQKIIQNIFFDDDIIDYILDIISTMQGEPDFVIEFLKFMDLHSNIKTDLKTIDKRIEAISKNNYLGIKLANPSFRSNFTNQFSQWSMLTGLIEKQLAPMRGSMWPASEKIKPHEDEMRLYQLETAKKKNKKQLNLDELLQAYRDFKNKHGNSKTVIEDMLKDNRVWK